MRGTPQTHLLAFSLLCLLSKVRGPRAPKCPADFLGVVGEDLKDPLADFLQVPGVRHSPASLPGAQTFVSGQLCCAALGESLLSEPQLLPQLNGHNDHKVFAKITMVIHQKCSAQDLDCGRCSKGEGHDGWQSPEPFYSAEGGVLIIYGKTQHTTRFAYLEPGFGWMLVST